jgi:hypothetical protein
MCKKFEKQPEVKLAMLCNRCGFALSTWLTLCDPTKSVRIAVSSVKWVLDNMYDYVKRRWSASSWMTLTTFSLKWDRITKWLTTGSTGLNCFLRVSWRLYKISLPSICSSASRRGIGPPVILFRDLQKPTDVAAYCGRERTTNTDDLESCLYFAPLTKSILSSKSTRRWRVPSHFLDLPSCLPGDQIFLVFLCFRLVFTRHQD